MNLKERVYSVLVVSSAEKLNGALLELMPASHYQPVRTASSVSAAKRIWHERIFDFVMVNSPLPDDPGIRFAIDVSGGRQSAVLLFVQGGLEADVRAEVVPHGVFTLAKPVSRPFFLLALAWMESAREGFRALEEKAVSFEEKMEEIRIVNRAKWLLISELKMDEPQAHRYLTKQAMDRCVAKKVIAEEILKTYS